MANTRRQPITIDHLKVPSDITYLPVLLTRDHLDDEVVDPSGSNAARTDGGDIRVYSDAGITELAREIVTFGHDTTTGAGDANVEGWLSESSWVVSSVSDTTYYIEYGDGALTDYAVTDPFGRNAVWSDYEFVSHLDSATPVDSTGNRTITVVGSPTVVAGPFANALDFDGTNDYAYITHSETLSTASVIQAWINKDSSVARRALHLSDTSTDEQLMVSSNGDGGTYLHAVASANGNTVTTGRTAVSNNVWAMAHADGVASTDTVNAFYIGGSATGTASSAWNSGGTGRFTIGAVSNGNSKLNGQVSEARWKIGTLSADWITAEYNNQNSPSTFATAGTPVAVSGANDATGSPQAATATLSAVGNLQQISYGSPQAGSSGVSGAANLTNLLIGAVQAAPAGATGAMELKQSLSGAVQAETSTASGFDFLVKLTGILSKVLGPVLHKVLRKIL